MVSYCTLMEQAIFDLFFRMGLKKDGAPIQQYFKNKAYKDQIAAFKAELADIGKGQGWTLDDLQKRFSNQLWDDIVYS